MCWTHLARSKPHTTSQNLYACIHVCVKKPCSTLSKARTKRGRGRSMRPYHHTQCLKHSLLCWRWCCSEASVPGTQTMPVLEDEPSRYLRLRAAQHAQHVTNTLQKILCRDQTRRAAHQILRAESPAHWHNQQAGPYNWADVATVQTLFPAPSPHCSVSTMRKMGFDIAMAMLYILIYELWIHVS